MGVGRNWKDKGQGIRNMYSVCLYVCMYVSTYVTISYKQIIDSQYGACPLKSKRGLAVLRDELVSSACPD